MEKEKSGKYILYISIAIWLFMVYGVYTDSGHIVEAVQSAYRLELFFIGIIILGVLPLLIRDGLIALSEKMVKLKYDVTTVVVGSIYICMILYFVNRMIWGGSIF